MLKYPQWLVLVGFIQAFNIMWLLLQFWKNYTPLLGGLVLWFYPLHTACACWERAAAQNLHDINRTHDSKFGTEVSNSENPPTAQQFSHALHVQCIISLPCFWAGGSAAAEGGGSSLFLSVVEGACERMAATAKKWLRLTQQHVCSDSSQLESSESWCPCWPQLKRLLLNIRLVNLKLVCAWVDVSI